jgi:hypothetical protein
MNASTNARRNFSPSSQASSENQPGRGIRWFANTRSTSIRLDPIRGSAENFIDYADLAHVASAGAVVGYLVAAPNVGSADEGTFHSPWGDTCQASPDRVSADS